MAVQLKKIDAEPKKIGKFVADNDFIRIFASELKFERKI
jgi:hypothetical protein